MAEQRVKWLDENCHVCGEQINSWDKRCSKALAYKHTVCEKCIAKEYDLEVATLRSRLEHHFGLRPCLGL